MNPLHRSHNSHHKQNHNSHVNKFSSLPFVAVITNREAYWCSARNSSGAARSCGAATPRSSDAHKRIAAPQALCVLREHPRPRPKSGKVHLSDTRPGDVCERAERSEGSDTTPVRNTPISPCEPLCAIFLRKPSVYPLSPVKANVAVCAGGVEVRVADALETLVWLRFLRFSRLFRGRKRKQDKRLASEPTLCPITSARSAGS